MTVARRPRGEVTPGRSRATSARVRAAETTRIKVMFTVSLPPCRHDHDSDEERLGCAISLRTTTANAIGGGIQANMFGINERLMQLGASDVMEWTVE